MSIMKHEVEAAVDRLKGVWPTMGNQSTDEWYKSLSSTGKTAKQLDIVIDRYINAEKDLPKPSTIRSRLMAVSDSSGQTVTVARYERPSDASIALHGLVEITDPQGKPEAPWWEKKAKCVTLTRLGRTRSMTKNMFSCEVLGQDAFRACIGDITIGKDLQARSDEVYRNAKGIFLDNPEFYLQRLIQTPGVTYHTPEVLPREP
jgi:hypothetical protein